MTEEKKVALKMIAGGQERDITFEELTLANNLAQEALVRLLIEKKLFTPQELMQMMETVKKERYRTPDQLKK
jgi:hypothetical protein